MEILLDTFKWSGAVGGAVLLLTVLKPVLDRRYSARWRYGVWLAMAVLLLLAPARWDALCLPAERPVVLEVPEMALSVSPQTGLNLRSSPAGGAGPAAGRLPALPLAEVLTALWLSGAALFLLYHLAGTWRFVHRARRWSLPAGAETAGVCEALCREMGFRRPPALRRSAAVDSPMAVGLLRPMLLLPEEAFQPRELDFILRHELIHCRRHDLWYKLVLLCANALHWFNPLIWLLRREAERDLELTCDSAVVAGADPETRRAYSETLLSSVRRRRERGLLSTQFYGGERALKERFRNILGKRGHRAGTALPVLALLVTAAAAGSVGVRAAAPEPVLEPMPEPVAESVPVRAPETAVPPEEDGRETGHGLPPTGVLGDYDGDGVRDTQIEINGRTYPLVWDSDMGEFEPLPGIDIPFSLTADYDGDSQPDSEVRINGQRWQITRNDDGTATYAQID